MTKTIEYYESLPYRLEIIPDTVEGGYAASFPELEGCITNAENISDLISNAKDAKHVWLLAALEDGIEIPEPLTADNYSGQFKLRMPKTLHKRLADNSRKEGISMNQYCLYLLAKGAR